MTWKEAIVDAFDVFVAWLVVILACRVAVRPIGVAVLVALFMTFCFRLFPKPRLSWG